MTQHVNSEPVNGAEQPATRRPRKPFPPMSFKETLILPKGIIDHGLNGEINRLTLLDKIGLKPSSSKTRVLISSSNRYGLTTGSYNSPTLQVTDRGQVSLDSSSLSRKVKETQFDLGIVQVEPFNKLYEKLKGQRLPDKVVLRDEFGRAGVAESDRDKAAEVFTENLRFLGLVHDVSGNDYVRAIEEILEEEPEFAESAPEQEAADSPLETATPVAVNGNTSVATNRPALHIDIQVHIDPASSAEQIDQIFASMARHLYGNEP